MLRVRVRRQGAVVVERTAVSPIGRVARIAWVALLVADAQPVLVQTGEFVVPEAYQGVGVDTKHFYAVDNEAIGATAKENAAGGNNKVTVFRLEEKK